MTIFDAIAPDGTCERLRFETQAEPDAGPPINTARPGTASTETSGPKASSAWVSIPED